MNDKTNGFILIAEDSPTQANHLEHLLTEQGYQVEVANNGQDALVLAQQSKPNLIISDILMPVMNGYELCAAVKRDNTLKDIPIILLTNLSDPVDIVSGLNAGADYYLTKPYDESLLVSRVKTALETPARLDDEAVEVRLEVDLAGEQHRVTTNHWQMLNLLLSTYENAVHHNQLLVQTQLELNRLNEQLEEKVKERTHDLRESEERYRNIFQTAAVSIWEEDFSEVKAACDELEAQGITDLRKYMEEHPEFLLQAAQMIKIVDVNETTLKMFGAKNKDELLGSLNKIFTPETSEILKAEILAIAEGQPYFEGESINKTLQGERLNVLLTMAIPSDPPKFDSVLVSLMDITERKRAEEQVRRNAALAEALARTASRINERLDLEKVFNAVCKETAHALDVPSTSVYLLDEKEECFYQVGDYGIERENNDHFQIIPRATYEKYFSLMGPLISIPQERDFSTITGFDDLVGWDYPVLVTAPLTRSGKLIGVIHINTVCEDRSFSEDDLAFFQGIADQAALAIANAKLYEKIQEHADVLSERNLELSRLYRASEALISSETPDPEHLAESIVEAVLDEFGKSNCSLLLIDNHAAKPRINRIAVAGPYADEVSKGELSLDSSGLVPKAIRLGQIINIPDVSEEPDYIPNWEAARSELAVPLKVGDKVIGVIDVQSAKPRDFSEDDERLMSIFAERAALALENAYLYQQTQERLRRLSALRNIDMAITGTVDLRLTLRILLEEVTKQLRVDAADVLLYNQHIQTLEYAAGRGFQTTALQHTNLRLGEGYAGKAALERRTIHVANVVKAENGLKKAPLLPNENFVTYYGVPLISKGEIKGVLEIFHRVPIDPRPDWLDFLETLAGQAAIAIDNATMFDGLQRSNIELVRAYDATLEGWVQALDMRDKETEDHTRRVKEATMKLAQTMGINGDELIHISRGALLHDIGKMSIPDSILLKSGKLTDDEWEIMRMHPVYAQRFLSQIDYLRPALEIPYCHHEKWDGTGYPQGLKGEQIPLAARIFAVVDVWDALRSDRPYRDAWLEGEALEYIRAQAGVHFDPDVVDKFLDQTMKG